MSEVIYATTDDLKSRFPALEIVQLSDDGGGSEIDDPNVFAACAAATHDVNAKLGVRFVVPFEADAIPPIIVEITTDLAMYRLYQRRLAGVPKEAETIAEDAEEKLDRFVEGKLKLEGATELEGWTKPVLSNKTAADRTFSKEILRGY